jgi:hypothetical protein
MPVTIDEAAMAKAVEALRRISSGDWLSELAMRVSAGGMKLTLDAFREQRDPYGKPWAPLKRMRTRDRRAAARAQRAGKVPRGHKILIDKGRMRGSVGASPAGHTGRVVIPTWYAAVHQNGASVAPHTRIRRGVLAHRAQLQKLGFATYSSSKGATFSKGFTIPQRMMLPEPDRPLPAAWQAMVESESKRLLRQKFGIR